MGDRQGATEAIRLFSAIRGSIPFLSRFLGAFSTTRGSSALSPRLAVSRRFLRDSRFLGAFSTTRGSSARSPRLAVSRRFLRDSRFLGAFSTTRGSSALSPRLAVLLKFLTHFAPGQRIS